MEEKAVSNLESKNYPVVVEICNKFKYEVMKCSTCPISQECSYTKKRIDALKKEASELAQSVYDEEVKLDGSAENTIRAQSKRRYMYDEFIRNNSHSILNNERCFFERQETVKILEKFINAGYDISDPRAYIVITELISTILNVGRMSKVFTQQGLLLQKATASGAIYYPNPLLSIRNEISESIMNAVKVLDDIFKKDEDARASKDFTAHLLNTIKGKMKKDIAKDLIVDQIPPTPPEEEEKIDGYFE